MYNRRMLNLAANEIETQIRAMQPNFTSLDYYRGFEQNYSAHYEDFVRHYLGRGKDRPHAIQIVHSQLMHTVNDRFHQLTRKVQTIPNPKGGDMSAWERY
jgi:hypothetical protein